MINVHGSAHLPLDFSEGFFHFSTDVAHVKEWPHMFEEKYRADPRAVPKSDFIVQNANDVSIHNLKQGHLKSGPDRYTMHYDKHLHGWFRYIARRRASLNLRD